MKCNQFLCILFLAVLWLSFPLACDFKITDEEKAHLFEKQEPIKCEKPCCHIFFNKYCEDCKNYRDNN